MRIKPLILTLLLAACGGEEGEDEPDALPLDFERCRYNPQSVREALNIARSICEPNYIVRVESPGLFYCMNNNDYYLALLYSEHNNMIQTAYVNDEDGDWDYCLNGVVNGRISGTFMRYFFSLPQY